MSVSFDNQYYLCMSKTVLAVLNQDHCLKRARVIIAMLLLPRQRSCEGI
jgi:hypothetical protein